MSERMSLQVKSGSELVFPMLFDHMSFATHRCWEINLKVAYAKTLSAWKEHFKGSLKAFHENSSVSQSIGSLLPALQTGRAKELPVGWLMQRKPRNDSQSANAAATMERRPRFHLHQSGWETVYIAAASFTICPE